MPDIRVLGETSNRVRLLLPLTGLTHSTSGLLIGTIADNEPTTVVYAQASSNIETISTLGTWAAPTSSKCRFKEVDATNHPYLYELQFADARFGVASAKRLIITVSGGGLTDPVHYEVQFTPSVETNSIATGAISAASVSAAAANKIADHVKRRTQANVEASSDGDTISDARSLYGLQQQAQESNTTAHAGKLTVFKVNGSTELEQLTIGTDPTGAPINSVS